MNGHVHTGDRQKQSHEGREPGGSEKEVGDTGLEHWGTERDGMSGSPLIYSPQLVYMAGVAGRRWHKLLLGPQGQ